MELIRQILQKTILPLREKREIFTSKFRFSILFRISLNYVWLFVLYGALFIGLFSFLFLSTEAKNYYETGHQIITALDQQNDSIEAGILLHTSLPGNSPVNPYHNDGLNLRIYNTKTKETIYDDIEFSAPKERTLFRHVYYEGGRAKNGLVFFLERPYESRGTTYNVSYQFDLTQNTMALSSLIPGTILLYLLTAFLILHSGKKGNAKLFSVISSMSATANRLTVNNLHSERLNVEGTKNELKDLATTINGMLDRIETSYESQKQFVSDASHELRTPISVIQGYANLLNRWGKKDESIMEEAIEAIQEESKEMQDLVEKLLFLSRHDKKTLKLNKTSFDMGEVMEDMIKDTRLIVKDRIIKVPQLQPVTVYGDKQALKQAIRVFIDNAVKYTGGEDTISISCENMNGDCVITVADTGIGMTQKDIDNIFERFYRSKHVRNEKISGNGLGLSIAKLIILKHTGRIKIRSQYEKGSTFVITLPKSAVVG